MLGRAVLDLGMAMLRAVSERVAFGSVCTSIVGTRGGVARRSWGRLPSVCCTLRSLPAHGPAPNHCMVQSAEA